MSYENAQTFRYELAKIGITETWVSVGCVCVQCYKHELKKMLRVANKLDDILYLVDIQITVKNRHGIFERKKVIRKQGQPIAVV